ncbi:MAG: diphthine synthase [Nanohaloarchaea archaeon]|nr:diphthine synthase [Candidatus Nanohaloarchaea archaeon]
MLYLIGLGISDEKDISLRGIDACKSAKKVYIELYTCPLEIDISNLETIIGKKIEVLDRRGVEESSKIINSAVVKDTVLLVGGDPLSATTHTGLILDAREKGIDAEIIHSSSIFTAVAECGLSLYKFGKVVSLPKPQDNYFPTSPYDNICDNLQSGAHTLLLLDIGMSANDAISVLGELEDKKGSKILLSETKIVVCAHLGKKSNIAYGTLKELRDVDFSKHPHCIIIPAKLNFSEEEYVNTFKKI